MQFYIKEKIIILRQNGRLAFETRSSQSFIFFSDCHVLCPIIIILLFLIVMKSLSYLVLGVFEKLPKKPGKVKDFCCCLNMKHTVPSENLYKVGIYTSLSYTLNEQKIFTIMDDIVNNHIDFRETSFDTKLSTRKQFS